MNDYNLHVLMYIVVLVYGVMAAQLTKLVELTSDRLNIDAGLVRYGFICSSVLPVAVGMYGCLSDRLQSWHLRKRRAQYQNEVRSKVEQLEKDVEHKVGCDSGCNVCNVCLGLEQ